MTTKPITLYVDAASYYFLKGYEKAPEKCQFGKPTAAQCIAETIKAEHLPPGWIEEKISSRSELEDEYNLEPFRDGVLYSFVKHNTFFPKYMNPNAIAKVQQALSNSITVAEEEMQEKYDELLRDVDTKAGLAVAKWEELKKLQHPTHLIGIAAFERVGKKLALNNELNDLLNLEEQKEQVLWAFLVKLQEKGVHFILKP